MSDDAIKKGIERCMHNISIDMAKEIMFSFRKNKDKYIQNFTNFMELEKPTMLNIIITTKFSAIHFWSDCDIEEVDYLRYPHRHEFYVKVKAPVIHDNREIEFIQLKNKIDRWISDNWDKQNIGSASCEKLCCELMVNFPKLTYVRILEDNENGAELIKEDLA